LLPATLRAAQSACISVTQSAILSFFSSTPRQISPHRYNNKAIGPQNLKILLKFYQISEYKRPAAAYTLRNFHEIYRVSTSFHDALAVKIGFAEGVTELWGF